MISSAERPLHLIHKTDLPSDGEIQFVAVEEGEIPEPYRRLLVHDRDMTPTLTAHFGQRIVLDRLSVRREADDLYRQVVLRTEGDGTAVEWGAIRIDLGRLPASARDQVLDSAVPFGGILQIEEVPHACRPEAYLRMDGNAAIRELFRATPDDRLYGRHSILYDATGASLAEAVEVLPPLR